MLRLFFQQVFLHVFLLSVFQPMVGPVRRAPYTRSGCPSCGQPNDPKERARVRLADRPCLRTALICPGGCRQEGWAAQAAEMGPAGQIFVQCLAFFVQIHTEREHKGVMP